MSKLTPEQEAFLDGWSFFPKTTFIGVEPEVRVVTSHPVVFQRPGEKEDPRFCLDIWSGHLKGGTITQSYLPAQEVKNLIEAAQAWLKEQGES